MAHRVPHSIREILDSRRGTGDWHQEPDQVERAAETTAKPIDQLNDTDFQAAYEQHLRTLNVAFEQFGPYAVERFRRLIHAACPQAVKVRFGCDEWENGTFLVIEEVLDADGNELLADDGALRDHLTMDETITASLSELTLVFGPDLPELEFPQGP